MFPAGQPFKVMYSAASIQCDLESRLQAVCVRFSTLPVERSLLTWTREPLIAISCPGVSKFWPLFLPTRICWILV